MPASTRTASPAAIVAQALRSLLLSVPASREEVAVDPAARSRTLQAAAARRAATLSAGLALPPGPAGLLTVVPDLVGIWRIQASLVADIARAHGQTASLTRESMVYCLFKHGSAALLRDLVVRAGERFVVRRASLQVLQDVLAGLGVRVTRQVLGRSIARWAPLVGAAAVGAYAYYDTAKVGDAAIELFSADVEVAPPSAAPA